MATRDAERNYLTQDVLFHGGVGPYVRDVFGLGRGEAGSAERRAYNAAVRSVERATVAPGTVNPRTGRAVQTGRIRNAERREAIGRALPSGANPFHTPTMAPNKPPPALSARILVEYRHVSPKRQGRGGSDHLTGWRHVFGDAAQPYLRRGDLAGAFEAMMADQRGPGFSVVRVLDFEPLQEV